MNNKKYLKVAVSLAKKAIKNNDIPVGAVVVDQNGRIIGRGYNRKEKDQNPFHHAEVIAIQQACKQRGSWRLEECIIYSTLEPCLMCLGTILQARISWIVFGLESEKFGSIKTLEKLKINENFNHSVGYTYEPIADSKEMLQAFFGQLRTQNGMI
ncbi:nucleoside deaminase [Spiroplasma platyhelix]|uniref:Nucleoside deaminase n=1 Tax=Spiroplasma platyhelix PALS-1 TaxID=1276218 RepID=A0A846UDJ0_9MOLU|nr:nucleoside deaminase [Spiroplasma platyhelix]MBE4704195.1 tRNA-specific adenosine deaminase [Spiroplasma platyhelix PALS-1]NKE38568.1 nucleoside deaminase [Spiroplasma platyhelix PALS-1]UJB28779.1 tRNA-specific adenosine deaminase [Spiroplasma platyhelix PALS-1]